MATLLVLTASVALAADWIVDGTSLAAVRGQQPVSAWLSCPDPAPDAPRLRGRALQTLGVAVVAYSKKQGTMTWGHGSLRALYCLDGELVDAEYEVYRLSAWNERQLREEHEDEAFATSAWLGTQRGRLVLFRNARPVDDGWYAEAQADNREIYEVWLDAPTSELDGVVRRIDTWYRGQLERLRRHQDLERAFAMTGPNCTSVYSVLPEPIREDVGAPITPFAWVRRLRDEGWVQAGVLYPSHHLVKRWGAGLPERSDRLHPVFRRRRRLPLDLVGRLHKAWLDAPPAVSGILEPSQHPEAAPSHVTSGIVRP